ncbi:MAG: penicillin-binding protein 1C [Elusimicrobia bacterium]|nr:penicillin-binding protein 1C [Elusimicrobiota bacterium]
MRAAALALLAAAAAAAAWRAPSAPRACAYQEVVARWRRSDAVLLDRRGVPLQERRVDASGRRLEWTALADVSPALLEALVAAEDRRFFRHHGVDWRALAAAPLRRLRGGNLSGASTITMQVAALTDARLRPRARRRSPGQKFEQLRRALTLERSWSKEHILEAYVNLLSFRGELQGAAAAARGLFGKSPHGLDREEALILAALPRAPAAAPAEVSARAARLGNVLGWPVDRARLARRAQAALAGPFRIEPAASLAPHAAERLLPVSDVKLIKFRERNLINLTSDTGITVRSTLDARLQRFAREALREQVLDLKGLNANDGALLVVDNRSGQVLAYVGHQDDGPALEHVDGIRALRQAGSTLKPLLYARAFDRRLITPETLLDDSPLEVAEVRGLFRPENYDHRFRGPVPARVALASSINVPAVRLAMFVGIPGFVQTLESAGITGLREPEFYGPSLALGSADVSLWDLVSAYRALANGGVWTPLHLTPGEAGGPARRVVSREAAYLVAEILADREDREPTFGLESVLATPFWTAVKTGTSKDMRDNWCLGFSERYTVGVWVGNHGGEPMWRVSGLSGAAPAWNAVMRFLHDGLPSRAPRAPVSLAALAHGRHSLPDAAAPASAPHAPVARIRYPPDGAILAVDPDIPAAQQAVLLEAQDAAPDARWLVDGADIGGVAEAPSWAPKPGHHVLRLADSRGRTLDEARIVVRGAVEPQVEAAEAEPASAGPAE